MTNTQVEPITAAPTSSKLSKTLLDAGGREVSNQLLPAHPTCSAVASGSLTCPGAGCRLSLLPLLPPDPQLLPREPRRSQMMSRPPDQVCGLGGCGASWRQSHPLPHPHRALNHLDSSPPPRAPAFHTPSPSPQGNPSWKFWELPAGPPAPALGSQCSP